MKHLKLKPKMSFPLMLDAASQNITYFEFYVNPIHLLWFWYTSYLDAENGDRIGTGDGTLYKLGVF